VDATIVLPGYTLNPGEFVVLEDELAQPAPPEVMGPGLINLHQNISWGEGYPGAVAISDPSGPVDFVRWVNDQFAPPGMTWADTPVPLPPLIYPGRTYGRAVDGVDSDQAADWCVQEASSAAANQACLQPEGQPGDILITEIDVGISGSGGRDDAVELYNDSPNTIELGGWILSWWSDTTNGTPEGHILLPDYQLLAGETVLLIDDAGWQPYVVGNEIHITNVNWSDALSGACAIRESSYFYGVDFVRWGPNATWEAPYPDAFDDSAGALPLIPGPSDTSLGRPALTDADLAADWCLMDLSLNAPNGNCQ
jgi:hypothetical protein